MRPTLPVVAVGCILSMGPLAAQKELRTARYQPARHGGEKVRQRVYQLFTYHQDGRLLHGR